MLDYLLQIELTTPRFSVRVSGIDELIISPKIITDSVLESEHKDRAYDLKTPKCQDLDCSEFYTSSFTSGKVSQCGDCLPRRTKTTYTKPFGCPEWNFLSRYLFDSTFTKPTRVSDSTTYNQYITWLTGDPGQAQLKQFLAKSGYWLGLPPCGKGSWQCLVDCAGGTVAGCWDNKYYGSAGFGLVYNINGSNYQVYDPVQILLAGLTPNGGSFPLLSGNPLTGLTANSGNPSDPNYKGCDRPYTKLEDARSCLMGQEKPEVCEDEEYQPKEGDGKNSIWSGKAIAGDFSGKSILSEGECYLTPTTSIIMNSWSLAGSLGGVLDVGRFDDPPLLINQVIENCGACIAKLVEENEGPSCCQVSYGKVVVRDSPIWDGSSWGSGGETWNNFWDDSIPDGGFRDGDNCKDSANPATCSWSSSCTGPQTGESANGIGTIPCNSTFKPNSCERSNDLVQVGHYEFLDCDTGSVIGVEPFFIQQCDGCGEGGLEDICYTIIQAPQPCSIETNPYGVAHEISRSQDDQAGNACGLSGLTRRGIAFPVCTQEQREEYGNYATTCCSDTSSSLNSTHSGGIFEPCRAQVFGSSKPNPSGFVPDPQGILGGNDRPICVFEANTAKTNCINSAWDNFDAAEKTSNDVKNTDILNSMIAYKSCIDSANTPEQRRKCSDDHETRVRNAESAHDTRVNDALKIKNSTVQSCEDLWQPTYDKCFERTSPRVNPEVRADTPCYKVAKSAFDKCRQTAINTFNTEKAKVLADYESEMKAAKARYDECVARECKQVEAYSCSACDYYYQEDISMIERHKDAKLNRLVDILQLSDCSGSDPFGAYNEDCGCKLAFWNAYDTCIKNTKPNRTITTQQIGTA